MPHIEEVRLMVKIARMYYDRGVRQQEIAERLSIHQSTISRLLKKARESSVVRITVVPPAGVYGDLEDALERKFNLIEAIIVDSQGDSNDERLERDLGTAAAFFLENTIKKNMIIGVSPWAVRCSPWSRP